MPIKEYFGTGCIGLFVEFPEGTDAETIQSAELILADRIVLQKNILEAAYNNLGYKDYKITVRSS